MIPLPWRRTPTPEHVAQNAELRLEMRSKLAQFEAARAWIRHGERVEKLRAMTREAHVPPVRWLELADGWTCEVPPILSPEARESGSLLVKHGRAGSVLESHNHPQRETILVAAGRLLVRIGTTPEADDETGCRHLLEAGPLESRALDIPPWQYHEFTAITDCVLLVCFSPPLVVEDVEICEI